MDFNSTVFQNPTAEIRLGKKYTGKLKVLLISEKIHQCVYQVKYTLLYYYGPK